MELPKSLNKYAKVFGGEEIQKVYASATPSLFSGADQAHLEKKNAEYKAGMPEFKEHSLLDEQ